MQAAFCIIYVKHNNGWVGGRRGACELWVVCGLGRRGTHACMVINKCRFKYHGNNCEIWQNNRKKAESIKQKCMKCNYK